jgi:hypothetical protein
MPKPDKVDAHKRERETIEEGNAQRDVSRPRTKARAWATVNKLPGGGNKTDARRKVPSGPLGGSGRKTNLSRSS